MDAFPIFRRSFLVSLCLTIAPLTIAKGIEPPVAAAPLLMDAEQAIREPLAFDWIDVRDEKAYAEGHISGAFRVDIGSWKAASADQAKLEDAEFWNTQVGGMGIDGLRPIAVYGAPLPEVARVWWLLKYLGCKDVRILDGGLDAFRAAGGKLDQAMVKRSAKKFESNFQKDRIILADELLSLGVKQQKCQIVDNRTSGEFDGTDVRGARGGHIPGAVHSDWQKYLGPDGKFLSKSELTKLVESSGVKLDQPLVTHCQSGGRSSVGAFVLEMLTGKPARNYYRSWSEWSGRTDLPVEKR